MSLPWRKTIFSPPECPQINCSMHADEPNTSFLSLRRGTIPGELHKSLTGIIYL